MWSSACRYYQKDIAILERVQQRATKMVKCIRKLDYQDRLKYLGLFSLERRRRRGDLIETFNILKQFDNVNPDQFFERSSTTNLRGHKLKLFKKRVSTTSRKNFISQRVINDWNDLPEEVVEASTVESFKKRLDKHMNSSRYGQ